MVLGLDSVQISVIQALSSLGPQVVIWLRLGTWLWMQPGLRSGCIRLEYDVHFKFSPISKYSVKEKVF